MGEREALLYQRRTGGGCKMIKLRRCVPQGLNETRARKQSPEIDRGTTFAAKKHQRVGVWAEDCTVISANACAGFGTGRASGEARLVRRVRD